MPGVLEELPGVNAAKVSFYKKRADVVYDGAKVSPAQMFKALRKAGYRGSVLEG